MNENNHPNKNPFLGILTVLDTPSDKAPSGARGHRVILTKEAAKNAIDSLIGMRVDMAHNLQGHNTTQKSGVITGAEIIGSELQVSGYIWGRDYPAVLDRIQASSEDLGMSYELAERAQIRSEVAKIVAKTDQIADEQIDWLAICESHEVDEDCEALRNGTSRHSTPQEDAEFLVLCFLACLPYAAWLIWSVVHFAQKWGLPW